MHKYLQRGTQHFRFPQMITVNRLEKYQIDYNSLPVSIKVVVNKRFYFKLLIEDD